MTSFSLFIAKRVALVASLAVVTLAVLLPLTASVPIEPQRGPQCTSHCTLWVGGVEWSTNSLVVAAVDPSTGQVGTRITFPSGWTLPTCPPPGICLGGLAVYPSGPSAVAVTDDGRIGVVLNENNRTLAVIDLVNGKLGAQIPVGGNPMSVALLEDNRTAYVVAPVYGKGAVLSSIDLVAKKVSWSLNLGTDTPEAIRISGDGRWAYLLMQNEGTRKARLAKIDLSARGVTSNESVPSGSRDFVVSPDGKTAYVLGAGIDCATVTSVALNGSGVTQVGNNGFGIWPGKLTIGPDGKTLYAFGQACSTLDYRDCKHMGSVFAIAIPSLVTTMVVQTPRVPGLSLVLTPNGESMYVAGGASSPNLMEISPCPGLEPSDGVIYPVHLTDNTMGTAIHLQFTSGAIALGP